MVRRERDGIKADDAGAPPSSAGGRIMADSFFLHPHIATAVAAPVPGRFGMTALHA